MKQKTRRGLQNLGVILLILAGFVWLGYNFIGFRTSTYTDNAQINQRIIPINSRIQGFVKEVRFDDYTFVHKGDTLVIIEDADFILQLAQAKANFQNALSGRNVAESVVSSSTNDISITESEISEVYVLMCNAKRDCDRYAILLEQDAVTQQQFDAVETNYLALKAKHDALLRRKESTGLVAQQQRRRLDQNDAGIEAARAAVSLAELNLSYTVILSPCDGVTSRRGIQPGQLVQPGQTIISIVDTADTWVIANYRETQAARIMIGDTVRIDVDALPGIDFCGVVETMSNATGAKYSPVPHDNATGNFVKVEQRIPVKIRFITETSADYMAKLRAGMNVECRVLE